MNTRPEHPQEAQNDIPEASSAEMTEAMLEAVMKSQVEAMTNLPQDIKEEIQALVDVQENWDGDGAYKPSPTVYRNFFTILKALPTKFIESEDVFLYTYPYAHGTLAFNWEKESTKEDIILEVGKDCYSIMCEFKEAGDFDMEYVPMDSKEGFENIKQALAYLHGLQKE